MTNFAMPNNSCAMKFALKTVSGLADVGVLYGDGDGPGAPPRCLEGSGKISNDYFHYAQQCLFYEICSIIIPWLC